MTADLQAVVERLEALLAKATPGPWQVVPRDSPLMSLISAHSDGESRNGGIYVARTQGPDSDHNVALITEAINALPTLLAALRQPVEGALDRDSIAHVLACNHVPGGKCYEIADAILALQSSNVRDTGRGG